MTRRNCGAMPPQMLFRTLRFFAGLVRHRRLDPLLLGQVAVDAGKGTLVRSGAAALQLAARVRRFKVARHTCKRGSDYLRGRLLRCVDQIKAIVGTAGLQVVCATLDASRVGTLARKFSPNLSVAFWAAPQVRRGQEGKTPLLIFGF